MFGVNSELGLGHNSHDRHQAAPKLTANEVIAKLTGGASNESAPGELYLLICLERPENIAIAHPEERIALRKVIERFFIGSEAVLAVAIPTDPPHTLTCGPQKILDYAKFLDSQALALHVACRAHYGLNSALTMLLETKPESPQTFRQLAGALFPKFGVLTGEELSQRLRLIEALGNIAFYPRPRPTEFKDRILGPEIPVVPITETARTDLSEELLAFLDRTQLFKGNATQDPEIQAAALNSLSHTIAVGGLISELHQIRRALPIFPELVSATSESIAKYSQSFMSSQLRQAAGSAAMNWGYALTQMIGNETKLGSLNTGKCLVNLAVAQFNGECEADLILRLCNPRSKEFIKFSDKITNELLTQLRAKHSPLKDALCPSTLPSYIQESTGNVPYAKRTAYNVHKLKLFDCLLQHRDPEVRDLAAAEMRHIGHQFRSFLFGENSALYHWTQFRASRPYRLAGSLF